MCEFDIDKLMNEIKEKATMEEKQKRKSEGLFANIPKLYPNCSNHNTRYNCDCMDKARWG